MLYCLVVFPVIAAIVLYLLPFKKAGKAIAVITQLILAACTVYVFINSRDGAIVDKAGNFIDGLTIALKADAVSSVFLLLSSVIFLAASLYNWSDKPNKLYWFLMLIWQGTLNGVFLSRDLFNIFVLIEVATVVVSILIMFNRDNRSMRDGMLYLMVNTVAVQFYLFGAGYIYKLTGTLDIETAAEAMKLLPRSDLLLPFSLIMTFVCLKCALVPLFSWLPRAHGTPGAPSSVSAILSGLHIKAGIYLFIRFSDLFGMIELRQFFLIAGVITSIIGFVFAISQTDIKLILAYHTISQIGMIMIGLNGESVYSQIGGTYHVVNHALFKSALFLNAGIIIKAYGTRDIKKISGLMRNMPIAGVTLLMAVLGITGAPFFNGSISKYFISAGADPVMNIVIIIINLGTIVSFVKYSSMLFGKKSQLACDSGESTDDIHRPYKCQQAAVLLLGTLCLIGGIFGEQAVEYTFGADLDISVDGYLQKCALFAASLIIGVLIYRFYITRSKFLGRVRRFRIGFRGICLLTGLFFALLLITARFV